MSDLLDAVVEMIAHDDYNHLPEVVLRERLAAIRRTHIETMLWGSIRCVRGDSP